MDIEQFTIIKNLLEEIRDLLSNDVKLKRDIKESPEKG